MKASIAAACVFAAVSFAPAIAAAQSRPFHCWFAVVGQPNGTSTYYVSAPFDTDALQAAVTDAWSKYVRAAYHIDTPQTNAQCGPLGPSPAQQEAMLAAEEQGWKALHAQVVHVVWSYGQDRPAVPASPTAAPSGPATATTTTHTPSPLNAKVGEVRLGPRTQRIHMSDDGDHIAIVAPKGSGEVVVIDGVEGPVFDEIPLNFTWSLNRNSSGSLVFSPSGAHSAYVARRGGDFIAVVDGKEAATLSTTAAVQNSGQTSGWRFFFNKDGSRLAYGAMAEPGTWVMVTDGTKSAGYGAIDFAQTALNGKRLVYAAQTGDQQWQVILDGTPGPAFAAITSLTLTPDGAHYAYIGTRSGSRGSPATVAVVDGVESAAYYAVADLEQAPDGRVAYSATTDLGDASGRGSAGAMFVGGLTVVDARTFNVSTYHTVRVGSRIGSSTHRVAFSPDGKRFAYIEKVAPDGSLAVMVNGKQMGPNVKAADELLWSPDGSHLAYQANNPTRFVAVVDGEEVSSENSWIKEFQWSPQGNRYVFQALAGSDLRMVVDGKEQAKMQGYVDGATQFSANGQHIAYGARQFGKLVYQPVLDGVVAPHNLLEFSTRNNPPILFPIFSYSPDGNHLAYVATTLDTIPKTGVVVDGVLYEGPASGFEFPSWSPNSKHFATAIWTGNGWTMLVDGKSGPSYEDILTLNSAACRFVDDRTFRFYAIKGDQIFRVALDVGA